MTNICDFKKQIEKKFNANERTTVYYPAFMFPFNDEQMKEAVSVEKYGELLTEYKKTHDNNMLYINNIKLNLHDKLRSACFVENNPEHLNILLSPEGREIICYNDNTIKKSEQSLDLITREECKTCELRNICKNLCPLQRKLPKHISDYWCNIYKKTFEIMGDKRLLAK
jgi:radical SAM protein with 4Fe4S-binding SPASM domain